MSDIIIMSCYHKIKINFANLRKNVFTSAKQMRNDNYMLQASAAAKTVFKKKPANNHRFLFYAM